MKKSDQKAKLAEIKNTKARMYCCKESVLRAVEKQMPMPVKVVVKESYTAKVGRSCSIYGYRNVFERIAKYYCQNCNNEISIFTLNDEEFIRPVKSKYCPYCGQKLWWR